MEFTVLKMGTYIKENSFRIKNTVKVILTGLIRTVTQEIGLRIKETGMGF